MARPVASRLEICTLAAAIGTSTRLVAGVIQAARWQQMPSTVLFDIHAWRARRIPWGRTDPSSDYTRDVRQDLTDGLLANGAFSSDEKLEFAAIWRLDPLALAREPHPAMRGRE